MRHFVSAALLCALAITLTGCSGSIGITLLLSSGLLALNLLLVGCTGAEGTADSATAVSGDAGSVSSIDSTSAKSGDTGSSPADVASDGTAPDTTVEPDVVAPPLDTTDTTDTTEECDGEWGTDCVDGKVVELCCPAGVACNFGMISWEVCEDGSCVLEPETCEEGCDGTWEEACVDGKVTELCCPSGEACNFGMIPWEVCADGSCAVEPETCKQEECDGEWGTDCVDGKVTEICCPAGMECNFGMSQWEMCGDGSCAVAPQTCKEEECDGTWETDCVDGKLIDVCCPAGIACNFGQLPWEVCKDGSCAVPPETCEPACDGEWEEVCEDGKITQACCPNGADCNFGQIPWEKCGDGTCAVEPETCKDEECDGSWGEECIDGKVTKVCCPAGMICNFGMIQWDLCPDGSCVVEPETCGPKPIQGALGSPCDTGDECLSGWCIDTKVAGEKVCSKPCVDDCPPGWTCEEVTLDGDTANLCTPD